MYAGSDAPLYAFSLFLPTIINKVPDAITNPPFEKVLIAI